MRWAALLLILATVGCVGDERVATQRHNVALRDALPALQELPPGFIVGWEQPLGLADAGEGFSRVYDHNDGNATTHHSLRVGVQRFPTAAQARETLDQLATLPVIPGASERLDDHTLRQHHARGAPDVPEEMASTTTIFRVDAAHLAWVTIDARGQAPLLDAAALADAILAKLADA